MHQTKSASAVFVSVVRDPAMYHRCIAGNPHVGGAECVSIDNRELDEPVPVLYNRFLDHFDLSRDTWLVFCHEDFEILEPPFPLLEGLARGSLWGPIGAYRRTWLGAICRWKVAGAIEETAKDGSSRRTTGNEVAHGFPVDTFDCQCLLAHSSLFRTQPDLRFDESMTFDLYVEDFCIEAGRRGISSRILPMRCCHHSIRHPPLPECYWQTLARLNAKNPRSCFAGTCSWIGGDVVGRHVTGWARRLLPPYGRQNIPQSGRI